MIGEIFGMLTVVKENVVKNKKGIYFHLCRCECGVEKPVGIYCLKNRTTVSCGCKRSRVGRTHGHCRAKSFAKSTYRRWVNMRHRCVDVNCKFYSNYGGRGITVCERWQGPNGFPNFLSDMGHPPEGMSLDRIDNNGNYTPENCRWAKAKTQSRNRRTNRLITHDGRTQTLADWAEEFGISDLLVSNRMGRGWAIGDALAKPRSYKKGVK